MRSFTTVAAAAALFTTALAAPQYGYTNPGTCLTPGTAESLVDGFGSLISNYQASVAEKILSEELTDWSDSINELSGIPLGSITFPTKEAFEQGQGSQPPVPFELLAIEAVTCDTIAIRWLGGLQPEPVKGITILKTSNKDGTADGWQISTIYTEFNSAAWVTDIGGTVTLPPH